MAEAMNKFGSTAGNLFGGDEDISGSVLGLENAFPMPSDLNRAFAIIGGQEDPAVKAQSQNLQAGAILARLQQEQRETRAKQAAQFSEILKTAKDFMPFIPEEERPKLAKSIAEKAKKAGHPFSDENIIAAYLNKPEDGALAMAIFAKAVAEGKSPDIAITDALQATKDPELRKHLLTGFFQLAGKEETLQKKAAAALAKGDMLPGFSIEETKKLAGGHIEEKTVGLNQQAAAAIAKNQPLAGFTMEETKQMAGARGEKPDQLNRLASEITARRSGKPAGSAVAAFKGLKDDELVKKLLGEANLAAALMTMLGLGGPQSIGPKAAPKYPTDADVKSAMTEAKGNKEKAKKILQGKGFTIEDK